MNFMICSKIQNKYVAYMLKNHYISMHQKLTCFRIFVSFKTTCLEHFIRAKQVNTTKSAKSSLKI